MNSELSAARLAKVRSALEQDAILVRDTGNIAWLTAFDGVFDDEQAHALLVTGDDAVLHTDSRYSAACRRAAEGGPVRIDDARMSHAEWLKGQRPPFPLALEDGMALAEFRALEKELGDGARERFFETHDLVLGLRAVKDAAEIDRLRHAQAITDAAFDHIIGFMKPGMTERQVKVELEHFMLCHGAEGLAFGSIVAAGPHGASPHAIPGDTVLEAGQCVIMDFGARARGYCSDMTRTVFLGEPDRRKRDAYRALREANESVEAFLKPGVTGAAAHRMAEDVLAAAGFGGKMGHGLGHGVGIDVHEEPLLSPRNDEPLQAGNVVTVEPGIYLEGEFGMRLEDYGVVIDGGFQVFTQSTHDIVII